MITGRKASGFSCENTNNKWNLLEEEMEKDQKRTNEERGYKIKAEENEVGINKKDK
jgi:hypothetical protein